MISLKLSPLRPLAKICASGRGHFVRTLTGINKAMEDGPMFLAPPAPQRPWDASPGATVALAPVFPVRQPPCLAPPLANAP